MRAPIFGVGLTARAQSISSQRRLNLCLEIRPEGDKSRIMIYGSPGLDLFNGVDFGDTPARGLHSLGNFLYVIHRGTFWEVNNAGIKVNRGTLNTTLGRVYLDDNGTIIMMVDGQYGYTYNTSTNTFAQIVDADYVPANTVTWLSRYFIQDQVNSGRFYISAIDNPMSWDALDFASAEGSPDNLVRVFRDHGELILFGDLTTEFWGNSGAQDFPFSRLGSAVVEWGLAARETVAKFDSSIMFLGRNRMGEVQVVQLNGYTPQSVGDTDFLFSINGYLTVNDATAFSYMLKGKPFYQINFPTANASWLYNGDSKTWSELGSDMGRHRANMGVLYLGKIIVSDYSNGKIYRVNDLTYSDNGAMIQRELISRPVLFGEDYTSISRFWLDMELGQGLVAGQGSNPQVMLSISKDGGHTYGTEVCRSAGKIGQYSMRVDWNRCGSAIPGQPWTFKARITDPIKVVIMGEGWINGDGS